MKINSFKKLSTTHEISYTPCGAPHRPVVSRALQVHLECAEYHRTPLTLRSYKSADIHLRTRLPRSNCSVCEAFCFSDPLKTILFPRPITTLQFFPVVFRKTRTYIMIPSSFGLFPISLYIFAPFLSLL